jgi:hypothetical protein
VFSNENLITSGGLLVEIIGKLGLSYRKSLRLPVMAASINTKTPNDRIVIPSGGLEQNNTNPIRLRIAPSVPIAGCLPRSESIFQDRHFFFGAATTFPKGCLPQFLQNLLSAVFSVPQWRQVGMAAIPSRIIFFRSKHTGSIYYGGNECKYSSRAKCWCEQNRQFPGLNSINSSLLSTGRTKNPSCREAEVI